MEFKERPIIIADVETTGLIPGLHEIVDIGAVKVDHNLRILDSLSMKVSPLRIETAEARALEINGYDPEKWKDASLPYEAAQVFSQFSKDGILCSWNITFEYTFLQMMSFQTCIPFEMDYHRIDISSIVWALLPDLRFLSLDAIAEKFGLPKEPTPHAGIVGAHYELAILQHLKESIQ